MLEKHDIAITVLMCR